jgi:CHAT domain-containing protein
MKALFVIGLTALSLTILGQKPALLRSIENLNAQGKQSQDEGNYALAEKYFSDACLSTDTLLALLIDSTAAARKRNHIKKRSIMAPKYLYFNSYDNLAALYTISGNYEKAEASYAISIKKRSSYFPKGSAHRIAPYLGLGKLFYAAGDLKKAAMYFGQASKMMQSASTSGYNYDALANQIYRYQCEMYLLDGNTQQAWKYLDRYFVALNTTSFSQEQMAEAFDLKARYYFAVGDYEQAEFFINRANKTIGSYSSTIYSPASLKIHKTKAILDWSRNWTDSTIRDFKTLIALYEQNIRKNFPAMSESEREQFFVTLRKDYDLFNAFVLQNLANAELLTLAYNNQLFTKALLLNETNKRKASILASGDQALLETLLAWEKSKQELAALYFRGKRRGVVDASPIEKRINELEKEMNKRLNTSVDSARVDWQALQAKLGAGESAIEMIRVNPVRFVHKEKRNSIHISDSAVYLALALTKQASSPMGAVIRNGYELETRSVHYFRNAIKNQLPDVLSYNNFWKPIKQLVPGSKRVYFSADGVFNQVNLNAMENPESHQFVVDEIDMVLVTNTKDLMLPKSSPGKVASLYGNPSFSGNVGTERSASVNSNQSKELSRSFLSRELLDLDEEEIAQLPGTENEVNSIEQLLKSIGWRVQSSMGETATEENLKSVASPGILHIATHGFFLEGGSENANSMIRSGILLAGVKNADATRQEDGVLTAYEATTLNLGGTGLVVLSACETGLGELKNGEGVYGLQRGFQVAGANNLLMSLWKVDDAATALLMQEFYKTWTSGTPIHEAFRQAQINLRQQYPHPYYWGSFILMGK